MPPKDDGGCCSTAALAPEGTAAADGARGSGRPNAKAHGHDHEHDRARGHEHDHDHDHDHDHGHGSPGFARMGAALALAAVAEAISHLASRGSPWNAIGMAVAAIAIWLAGVDVYRMGFSALLRGRLDIGALMSVAVTGAFLIGQWPEAAMVMALFGIAELIEARALDRSRRAIEALLCLAPEEALVRAGDGHWVSTRADAVQVGAIVRVKPGARLPLDGVITAGHAAIDEAPVTGESIPLDKGPGDSVYAGTINGPGEFELRVTALAKDTTLARIIHAVEEAQHTRAPTQRLVDRFATCYTPAVFALAVAVAVGEPLLFGAAWLDAAYRALVLLVIGCPCALVISTPVSVVSGLAAAARRGILIKGGTYLESARRLKVIALDKTGTLTEGKPKLVDWMPGGGFDRTRAASLAASLAARSDHPVSQAIRAGVDGAHDRVTAFKALPGRGVEGEVDGAHVLLGNHRAVHALGLCTPQVEAQSSRHEQQGRTVTLLARNGEVVALFAVADTMKPTSRRAVQDLSALGIRTVLLTGDNDATAKAIAAEAGISESHGDLLPEQKLEAVRRLQREHGATGMVGDGINDAPALAQADIGYAMGAAGTHVAMESADIVVMNDNLQRVAESVRLSRSTYAVLWQNIALALGIKAVFFALAVAGMATMWMAVFADMGASLLVVANGLRLLGAVAPREPPAA